MAVRWCRHGRANQDVEGERVITTWPESEYAALGNGMMMSKGDLFVVVCM